MPRRQRREHDIDPLVKLAWPERFLFFDSESRVPKPETDDDRASLWGTEARITHEPRLIMLEYWEAAHENDRLVYKPIYVYHSTVCRRNYQAECSCHDRELCLPCQSLGCHPILDAFHNFKPTDIRPELPPSEREYPTPELLCRAFWQQVTELAEWVTHGRTHRKLTVVAHNTGYDVLATAAYRWLGELGWVMEYPYEKGPVYICRATKGTATIDLISSTNFYHATLKEVAKSFGEEKLNMKREDGVDDFNTPDVARLSTYCRQDVHVCERCIIWLAEFLANGEDGRPIGPWRSTIASIAFAVWRYRFIGERHVRVHLNGDATMLERSAYVGGRTEVWRLGLWDGECYDLDVNNLYGYVMKTFQVPFKLHGFEVFDEPSGIRTAFRLEEILDGHYGVIANVTLSIDRACVPLKGSKLFFPVGRFRTTLCTPELRLAMKYGRVESVHTIAYYEMAPLFEEAITWLSEKRVQAEEAGEKAKRRLYKDLANNLYGKFGQLSEEWVRVGDYVPGTPLGPEALTLPGGTQVTRVTMPSGIYQSTGHREEAFNAFPAIAAFITSYARVHLWKMRTIADGEDGRHTLYCDTDALVCDRIGYKRLTDAGMVSKSKLGMMKLEWRGRRAHIDGAKWYSAETENPGHEPGHEQCVRGLDGEDCRDLHWHLMVKRKGVPDRATLVNTPDGPRFYYEAFPRMRGLLATGNMDRFSNVPTFKKTTVEYTKARNPNGPNAPGWLPPFRLPDDALTNPDLVEFAL